jgi:hypothetical protein
VKHQTARLPLKLGFGEIKFAPKLQSFFLAEKALCLKLVTLGVCGGLKNQTTNTATLLFL